MFRVESPRWGILYSFGRFHQASNVKNRADFATWRRILRECRDPNTFPDTSMEHYFCDFPTFMLQRLCLCRIGPCSRPLLLLGCSLLAECVNQSLSLISVVDMVTAIYQQRTAQQQKSWTGPTARDEHVVWFKKRTWIGTAEILQGAQNVRLFYLLSMVSKLVGMLIKCANSESQHWTFDYQPNHPNSMIWSRRLFTVKVWVKISVGIIGADVTTSRSRGEYI